MNFETVKEALEFLYSVNRKEAKVKVNGKPARVHDIQEMNREAIFGLCDLLGMEDIYLKDDDVA
ncbi:hypothetical protein [Ligilactobacillus saerimneri]|uniref:hypothetical protein n=1 Tax=Ligilactobacillus saerimneri TaxID=228229 RepID=UPI0024BB2916|nr:hypothetical protein [Ligilactobacillus saerimneri]